MSNGSGRMPAHGSARRVLLVASVIGLLIGLALLIAGLTAVRGSGDLLRAGGVFLIALCGITLVQTLRRPRTR